MRARIPYIIYIGLWDEKSVVGRYWVATMKWEKTAWVGADSPDKIADGVCYVVVAPSENLPDGRETIFGRGDNAKVVAAIIANGHKPMWRGTLGIERQGHMTHGTPQVQFYTRVQLRAILVDHHHVDSEWPCVSPSHKGLQNMADVINGSLYHLKWQIAGYHVALVGF